MIPLLLIIVVGMQDSPDLKKNEAWTLLKKVDSVFSKAKTCEVSVRIRAEKKELMKVEQSILRGTLRCARGNKVQWELHGDCAGKLLDRKGVADGKTLWTKNNTEEKESVAPKKFGELSRQSFLQGGMWMGLHWLLARSATEDGQKDLAEGLKAKGPMPFASGWTLGKRKKIKDKDALSVVAQLRFEDQGRSFLWTMWVEEKTCYPLQMEMTFEDPAKKQSETITEFYIVKLNPKLDKAFFQISKKENEDPKVVETHSILIRVERAISGFRLRVGSAPRTLEELVRRPEYFPEEEWPKGGFLPDLKSTRDAWGKTLLYVVPKKKTDNLLLGSLGADGKKGGKGANADIWNQKEKK